MGIQSLGVSKILWDFWLSRKLLCTFWNSLDIITSEFRDIIEAFIIFQLWEERKIPKTVLKTRLKTRTSVLVDCGAFQFEHLRNLTCCKVFMRSSKWFLRKLVFWLSWKIANMDILHYIRIKQRLADSSEFKKTLFKNMK
jgi:hypothetical protein